MQTLLVLGGAKSGKSDYALEYCNACNEKKYYIATAQAFDDEMEKKIQAHKEERDNTWTTINAPTDLCGIIEKYSKNDTILLIDCLTMWLSNLLLQDASVKTEIDILLSFVAKTNNKIVFVSNEVGMGLVPDTPLGRKFRDAQGILNKQLAKKSDKVVFVASGLPLTLKG